MFYSSAQTANGLCDIAAPNGGTGEVIYQGVLAQQALPLPDHLCWGGEHCEGVGGSPSQGVQSGPAVPTQARLTKDGKAKGRCVHAHTRARVWQVVIYAPCLNVCISVYVLCV